MPDFSQPVAIAQYQNLQLHQQPPPPSADNYDEEESGAYRYPGSGVGVLPTTGLPTNGMGYPSLPLRSNSHPSIPTTTEYLISPQTIHQPSLFPSPQSATLPPSQTIPSTIYTEGGDVMQGGVKVEASPPPPQSGNTGGQPYLRVARFVGPPPVPLACTECRSRHLKCDAGTPSCSRCVTDTRDCVYVKSRRGWKGSRRRTSAQSRAGSVSGGEGGFGVMSDGGGNGTISSPSHDIAPQLRYLFLLFPRWNDERGSTSRASSQTRQASVSAASNATVSPTNSPPVSRNLPNPGPPPPNALENVRNHYRGSTNFASVHDHVPPQPTANLIQLYYAYFHSAHPFILPPAYLIKTAAAKLTQLLPVMRFIGSFYAPSAPHQSFRDAADFTLFQQNAPRNSFTVQAMLLFAIGLHADNLQERSGQVKDIAIEMALELGMNLEGFAEAAGEGDPVIEESWRRTWWELYFLDGIFAGVHQRDCFRLWSVECTVPLPCEEQEYLSSRIPPTRSLVDFDERYFSEDNRPFSSYAYRVEAVRILGQVLACGGSDNPDDPRVDSADTSLVNWMLHLPAGKKELVDKDGRVDEMLFQAHMVINAASIYLHRPKSHLAISLVPDETSCTPPTQWTTTSKPVAFHTTKAIRAADAISKLITLPTPLIKHTPFFTCIITLSAIVHLSACSWLLYGEEGFMAKERIRLSVGALKTLEDIWHVAGCVLMQVKVVSREVFALPRPEGSKGGGVLTEEEFAKLVDDEQGIELIEGAEMPLQWDGQ
ncbi:hypothetical protein TWF703_003296 [Orbilia oligospora]|uniref:Zn(2)-C6 fungal-type domain-containing protein n=1 Tax=Orbilia oligospora TaxID=2813651 RepID=A0A7C8JQ86_ORBOL|nr:hypothetical protein TWF703_003296 [Orbilia oligospora]